MEENILCHIVLLGQSLSMGFATEHCLEPLKFKNAYMFKQVRTQDFGYIFGITKDEYNKNPEKYEKEFYWALNPICETGGKGDNEKCWESASPNEYETPASGIAYGLWEAYKNNGYSEFPYKVLISAPGIGGTDIREYGVGSKIYERTKKDIENGKRLAEKQGLKYKVLAFVWMQGENNYNDTEEWYYSELIKTIKLYRELTVCVTGNSSEVPFVSYQTMGQKSYYPTVSQAPALAQFAIASDNENQFYLTATCYQFETYIDKIHMTAVSSRNIGILLGKTIYEMLNDEYKLFKPNVYVDNNEAILKFPFDIKLNANGVFSSYDLPAISLNGGFFCYDTNGSLMNIDLELDNNRALKLHCNKAISKITYGYVASDNMYEQYTYGGILCTKKRFNAYGNAIEEYMPIQNLYG